MILTVSGFISELMSMYPNAFTARNQGAWSDRYTSALNGVKGTIDFKRLWQIYEDEYQSTTTPPSPHWVKCAAKRALTGDSTGDISATNTITCVINGAFYEFVTAGASSRAVQKAMDKSEMWWHGNWGDCPDKKRMDEIRKRAHNEWSRKK